LAQKQFHMAVIAGPLHERALAKMIQAAVSYMRPPCCTLLHNTDCTGSPWPVLNRKVRSKLHHLFVRTAERQVKKAHWIEQRLSRVPERLEDDLLRHLCCLRSICVASHAIDNHEQSSVLRHGGGHPVLILLAPAEEADVSVVNPQEEIR